MTLDAFRSLILSVDPDATRYEGNRKGNYTVWQEYGMNRLHGDSRTADRAFKVQVDRFTKAEDDPIVEALFQALDGQDGIAFEYLVDYEVDTGYIHHIYDCEVI